MKIYRLRNTLLYNIFIYNGFAHAVQALIQTKRKHAKKKLLSNKINCFQLPQKISFQKSWDVFFKTRRTRFTNK